MRYADFLIAGAGIMGLSLALELERQGASVTVLERGTPLAEASTAAAGMLAAHDPGNPPELLPLSQLSLSLYPGYLARIESLSGAEVAFQTSSTLQSVREGSSAGVLSREEIGRLVPQLRPSHHSFVHLHENSIDPRQLAPALLKAVGATSIRLLTDTSVRKVHYSADSVEVETSSSTFTATRFVDCTGAWASACSPIPARLAVRPVKGQVLSVLPAAELPLQTTVRTPTIYVVPRTSGPNAGRFVIGATIEEAGFDKSTHAGDISALHAAAADLLPALAGATVIESWAGLRPGTPDHLPLLGALPGQPNHLLCTGHFRDGILLAPASARVMAEVLRGEQPSVDIRPFSPSRALHSHG